MKFRHRFVQPHAARNQLNCRGSNPHSRMTHHEGVVSLTPNILLTLPTAISEGDCPSLCLVASKEWPKSDSHIYQQEKRMLRC